MRSWLILLAIAIIFVLHSLSLNFTQDDAFISYRYAENFIQGQGLVFNQGERVEGYTNFLWIIILSLFAKIGLDMITVSKILGIASGCVTLFLLYRISQLLFPRRDWLLALFTPFLLAASGAFAYWSISGLETSFFVLTVVGSIYIYLTGSRWWGISCAVAGLVRPEGALIFGILFLHKLLLREGGARELLSLLGGFMLIMVPFGVFKITYYGDVLPNPFYAKTGFSSEYLKSGLEYFWQFLTHYGLWGLLYLLPLILHRRLSRQAGSLLVVVYVYTLYVIVVGGDVLKVHRFFLPVLPLMLVLLILCLRQLSLGIKSAPWRRAAVGSSVVLISAAFFLIPRGWIRETRTAEKMLVERMQFVTENLKQRCDAGYSIAVTTIGSLSYYMGTGVKVVDMLGLTDRHIACHPEAIEGIAATWKERKYNTSYLLSLDPDFILFSTGYKPSAPAERALLLNSKFRKNYHVVPLLKGWKQFVPAFKRKGIFTESNEVYPDARFVDLFYEGVSLHMRGRNREAVAKLKEVIAVGPKDFSLPHELMGLYWTELREYLVAESCFKKAIEIDDHTVLSHVFLASIYTADGRLQEAEEERRKVYLYDPDFPW